LTLRRSARSIFDAALAAGDVRPLVAQVLAGIAKPERGRVLVVGAGKASGAMAAAVEAAWGDRITDGVVAVKDGYTAPTRRVRVVEAGHPVPDERGAAAAREIRDLAESAGAEDLVLVLVSGGGSALTPAPAPPVTLADKQAVTRLLLAAGATINQLNAVRKHCSLLKGGQLARAAAPARVEALLLSDVVGDPLDVIASGPTTPDDSTFAEALGILDMARGAKITGSGFPLFTGQGARLVRALVSFMLDLHTREHGYVEVSPPLLVNRDSAQGTGQLPDLESNMYVTEDGLYLIPTAEVPVTNIHRDEILAAADLPRGYAAYTPCFRREAGAHGKDTRGLIRIHQFDKVELVRLCQPQHSAEEHAKLLGHAEAVLQRLELPYRVVLLASADTGFASAKTYDLEVWAAGVGTWLEASSASCFTDFQARRANIRYRKSSDAKPDFVHTLNASGVAFPRSLIALLENNQEADGSVRLPKALVPYFGEELLRAP